MWYFMSFWNFWDSGILSDDVNLDIAVYNLVRTDHTANVKRGGICIYFRKYPFSSWMHKLWNENW